jgi:hypothetical protein
MAVVLYWEYGIISLSVLLKLLVDLPKMSKVQCG